MAQVWSKRWFKRALPGALVACLAVTGLAVKAPEVQAATPAADAFYTPPSPLPAGKPGDIIRSRRSTFTLDPIFRTPVPLVNAWQVLYRDFQVLQQRLTIFEQKSAALEAERDDLLAQLKSTRIEIENLQLDILQQPAPQQKPAARSDRKGGPAAPEQTDDLKIINGISPFAEQQLHALGIHSFSQISRWDDDSVLAFAKALNISPAKIFQEDWVGQAQHLVREHL